MEYKKYENETNEELIYRICSEKEQIGSWQDVADILNELLGFEYTESKYRKQYQAFEKMLDANRSKFTDADKQLETIKEEQRKLQRERMKLQTEKIEYNRWLREHSRDELICEHIVDAINSSSTDSNIPKLIEDTETEKAGLLVMGDEHFGAEFTLYGLQGEVLNSYSPEIFYHRMDKLLTQTVGIVRKEGLTKIDIFSMGDFSDGVLRMSQLMKLRYGVVEGTVIYAKYICNWLEKLSEFVNIRFHMVSGNHTELRMLGAPKGTFTNENMEIVVRSMINERLKNNPNFKLADNPTKMIYTQIFDYNILGIHGEVKNMGNAIREFSHIYDKHINYLVAGHLHHTKTEDVGIDCKVINVPSVIGIDDYSLSLRKTSNPGATFIVFNKDHSSTIEYNINLS